MEGDLVQTIIQGGSAGILVLVVLLNHFDRKDQRKQDQAKDDKYEVMQKEFSKAIEKNSQIVNGMQDIIKHHLNEVRKNMDNNTSVIQKLIDGIEKESELKNQLYITMESLKQLLNNKQ